MVEYFRNIEHNEVALDIARRFVNTVYQGWVNTNYIFEKYNADELGVYGGGGEYVVQEGFGWTNGVVIKFIEWFGDELKLELPAVVSQVHPVDGLHVVVDEARLEAAETPKVVNLAHSQSASNQSTESAESTDTDASEPLAIKVEGGGEEEVGEEEAPMSAVFSTEEQVKRRMSEVISNEISNEISISIQHMEI